MHCLTWKLRYSAATSHGTPLCWKSSSVERTWGCGAGCRQLGGEWSFHCAGCIRSTQRIGSLGKESITIAGRCCDNSECSMSRKARWGDCHAGDASGHHCASCSKETVGRVTSPAPSVPAGSGNRERCPWFVDKTCE